MHLYINTQKIGHLMHTLFYYYELKQYVGKSESFLFVWSFTAELRYKELGNSEYCAYSEVFHQSWSKPFLFRQHKSYIKVYFCLTDLPRDVALIFERTPLMASRLNIKIISRGRYVGQILPMTSMKTFLYRTHDYTEY